MDAVVNLAGAGIGDQRWSEDRKRVLHDSRTQGTDLLARTLAGLARPPAVLVSGSAVGYYGDSAATRSLTEVSAPGDGRRWPTWSATGRRPPRPPPTPGSAPSCCAPGSCSTATAASSPALALPFRLFLGGRLGSGRQWVSWITLADEVAAIRFVIDHGDVAGPVNAVAPEPVTNAELAKAIGTVLGRPSFLPAPAFAFRVALGRDMADELILRQPAGPAGRPGGRRRPASPTRRSPAPCPGTCVRAIERTAR